MNHHSIEAAQPGFAIAAELPDILPPVRERRGVSGFVWRHPTLSIGLAILGVMLLIAIFATVLVSEWVTAQVRKKLI